MLPNQFQELLEKFSRGECTPEEEQFVIDWYNNIPQPEKTVVPGKDKVRFEEKLWAAINPMPVQKRSWRPLIIRAAIITIPLLALAGFFFDREFISTFVSAVPSEVLAQKSENRFFNEGKTARPILLQDGSKVVLQPDSEIITTTDFNASKTREVRLKGEAFFEVERDPGKPFMVYTNEVVTRVLGTSFNIRAYENDREITVAVKTGKVSVYANSGNTAGKNNILPPQEVILTPNQQMVYHRVREEVIKQLVENPEIILPNSNLFRMQFENAEVAEIFQVLEENYGVEILYDKALLNDCKLTTSMSDEGLYERIQVICKAIGATYSVKDAVISIKSNGC
jgi:transmembrane sensor